MTSYIVQYELPVDNPSMGVSKSVNKRVITFYVPINHPNAHNLGYRDLVAATELSGLCKLSTPLNKNKLDSKKQQ